MPAPGGNLPGNYPGNAKPPNLGTDPVLITGQKPIGGPLAFQPDNTFDIGGPSNTNRPRNITLAGALSTGSLTVNNTGSSATFSGTITAAASTGTAIQALQGPIQVTNGSFSWCSMWGGSGAPGAGLGNNGDYYFRTDTPATANQRVYVKSAGAWTGII